MATIKELKTQIENANALGRQNLTDKGVVVAENATTYDIMQMIADISGGGASYESIVYNEDNTITLTDKDGIEHTMACVYEDGKLISVTYDGKAIELVYEGDKLVSVGKTNINLSDAKTGGVSSVDNTVIFLADGKPYEVVSVKNGNSVNAPSGTPVSENGTFTNWQSNGKNVMFPYTPESDVEINALFQTVRNELEINSIGVTVNSVLGTKTTDETAILGYYKNSNGVYCSILVGKTETAVNTSQGNAPSVFEYEGVNWYVRYAYTNTLSEVMDGEVEPYFASARSTVDASGQLLNYYFIKV